MKASPLPKTTIFQSVSLIAILLLTFGYKTSVQGQDSEKIFRKGVNLYEDNQFKEALIYIDSSLNMDSSMYQRFSLRANIKVDLKMYKAAIEDITRCINHCQIPNRRGHLSNYYLRRSELLQMDNYPEMAFSDTGGLIT